MHPYGYSGQSPYGAPPAYAPPAYGAPPASYAAPYGTPPPPNGAHPAPYGAPPAPYDTPPAPYGAPPAPYGAPPAPYGAPPAPYGTPPPPNGANPAPYGAPLAPYGAPQAPYGAPQAPYGAPQAPYGAPQAPYGAPPAQYGAPQAPYGAPPAQYGAPQAPYGAPQAPYGTPAPANGAPPPAAPASAPYSSGAPASAPSAPATGQQQQHPGAATPGSFNSHQTQSQPAATPAPASQPAASGTTQNAGYPSLTAPPPPQTVLPGSSGSSNARPASAYPTIGGGGTSHAAAGPTPSADALARPATAVPRPAPTAQYGAPYGAPQYSPQQPTAPFTYGQPPAAGAAPQQHYHAAAAVPAAPYGAPPPAAAPPPAQPYMPPTTYAPAPGHGGRRRRAVLVGCSYPGSSAALNGCLNDVQCIQFCLQKRFGFTEQQIVVLRDDPGRHRDFTSSKANIYRGIQWLMTDQRPGDSLFFHFSGHGSQQHDRNGDEEDGYDETICPSDFRQAGQIVDDELNRMMVRPLLPGVTLHAVIDACHSGTALDLAFRAKVDGAGRWYWKGRPRYDKLTAGGTAFQFGACKDSQVAQDTNKLSGYTYTGAATFCFIQAIEKYGADQTYGQILSHMMSTLRSTTGSPGLNLGSAGSLIAGFLLGSAAAALTSGGQTPVLSCDKQVDLYGTKLSL